MFHTSLLWNYTNVHIINSFRRKYLYIFQSNYLKLIVAPGLRSILLSLFQNSLLSTTVPCRLNRSLYMTVYSPTMQWISAFIWLYSPIVPWTSRSWRSWTLVVAEMVWFRWAGLQSVTHRWDHRKQERLTSPQQQCSKSSRVAQRSNALHLSARGITTDPGSIPGCITTGCDWKSHRVAHHWPSVIRVWVWPG